MQELLTLAKQMEVGKILLWTGLAIAGVIAASVVVLGYRRRLLNPQRDDQGGLMDDLRAMKNRGEISDEEFAAAKHAMVARISGKGAPPAPVKPKADERVAKPGFDLTGQPLPKQNPPGV